MMCSGVGAVKYDKWTSISESSLGGTFRVKWLKMYVILSLSANICGFLLLLLSSFCLFTRSNIFSVKTCRLREQIIFVILGTRTYL